MSIMTPRVLLIDDEEPLLMGLAEIMKRAGYNILTARDGQTGLSLARQHLPDLIICDVMMPAPNGFELRRQLSQESRTENIPFIFLTARAAQSDKLQGFESGADDYITKPFDRQELILRAQAVLRRSEMSRQRVMAELETRMDDLRREVVKNVSHELRTPLAQVLGVLELAVTDKFGEPEERQWFIEAALNSARLLHALIEDLITLTHVDQGQLSTYRQKLQIDFDIIAPIQRCQERYATKNLILNLDIPIDLSIAAPRLEFRQSVGHLADNAFKFSAPGGQVWVSVAQLGGNGCVFTIQDEGIGIPAEFRGRVFDRFFQISQGNTREYGGLGVGLYVSRAIARSLGGDVALLDSDTGCRVQMTIPPTK